MTENSKKVLYDVRWQSLRVSLLGKFNSPKHIRSNIAELHSYLFESVIEYEKFLRCWRVLNLLNATRMSFNATNSISSLQDHLLKEFRREVQHEYRKLQLAGVKFKQRWDWDIVKKELSELYFTNKRIFDKIESNLIKRTVHAVKKQGSLQHRQSLQVFLRLMREVIIESEPSLNL